MRLLNKIAYACCAATFGLMAMTSCEGGELYDLNAPDWISDKVESIANEQNKGDKEEVLEGMQEDVYSIGNTDFTSGFWSAFSKYYVIPDGKKFNAVFNLNINPSDNTYYKNFALILTNDVDRNGDGYVEYGAIRFDDTADHATYNSQWGEHIDQTLIQSTMLLNPVDNQDANVQKLGGKITLTVDRSDASQFIVKIKNASNTKTYTQPYALENLNADATNTNIRCFLVPEGSYINFLQANIEPIGGYTSAEDKQPVSMELAGVPDQVGQNETLEDITANITATITFEEGVTKVVTAKELQFSAVPDLGTLGEKTLIVLYNKTFKGENCEKPIMATATFEVVDKIVALKVTSLPTQLAYTCFTPADMPMYPLTTAGLEVEATYGDGSVKPITLDKLQISTFLGQTGKQTITLTADSGVTTSFEIDVTGTPVSAVTNSTSIVGNADNTSLWWSAFSDDFNVPAGETRSLKFKNFSSGAGNWNNFVVILRKADLSEYAVVRADNYGWGAGYEKNANLITYGTQGDWATWLPTMNGADVTVYVTNVGDGTADIQAVMTGNEGSTYVQGYYHIAVDAADVNFALTVDGSHYEF